MKNFEVIARAVILHDNKILLCKRTDRDYWFLPGGHVEFGEQAETALAREIKEELGLETSTANFIGASENIFIQDKIKHHEFNLIFYAQISRFEINSKEAHLEFIFMPTEEISSVNILPKSVKKSISIWLGNKNFFWAHES